MKQLVLFDIDGTLVTARRSGVEYWKKRVMKTFDEAYGCRLDFALEIKGINGMIDREWLWVFAERAGISRKEFLRKVSVAQKVFHRELKHAVDTKNIEYVSIEPAIQLVELLKNYDHIHTGLVTGNTEKNALLKLKSANTHQHFTFGLYSDRVDDRLKLVAQVFDKARRHFKEDFAPQDVVIIGDTVHDIRAGKSIGAHTIGVASGLTDTKEKLKEEHPTIAVNTLMDPEVLDFFKIKNK